MGLREFHIYSPIRKYAEEGLGHDYRLPWYLKQKYDKAVPPGPDERDIRSQVLSG